MKYNIRDRLLCKTDRLSLTKGKYYTIKDINNDSIYIVDDNGYIDYFMDLDENLFAISKYFYTKNEVRKLKLEKINGI